ncbi:MAG: mandelate racemase/muconate lactonizing enzyme family protein [Anaerolineae bacterium]|uniref:mandelate racemase/muconate lactonizing enzyme family protein n=1 Tax=Candidatus Flexifilum breve TaxID=3140694 RepID=UPI001AC88E6E|nr:mandelate racemase/muconate lactonizing enzyme family protein [Chloroflexota bacterium]MBK9745536.1 mandelate racemase/muconate lactonizing enzyme family protein [Chloroflexota bacterium]MBN8638233.1 mandelate racemase/muconate lactonizing enzyme family protein [Anaerolineae bacterium]
MRVCHLRGLPMDCSLIRLDTNQGISGYGEVRDWASPTYALMLKSRLIGENPCNIDKIFRKIKQFGHHGRQGGGVSGIEMALFDLAGKAYNVPAYQLLGGKFRSQVLCYCDTDSSPDGRQMGERLKRRMDRGFKFLKMDVGIGLLRDVPGALSAPPEMLDSTTIMHPFTGIQVTQLGIEYLVEYVRQVREIIGYEIPLAADHFGHLTVESAIRLGRALDRFTLAWYEDVIPWQLTDQWVRLAQSVTTPLCTGEDIYLKEGFRPLLEAHGVSVIHPDLATAGGLLETKKIGDLAQEHGVAMAMHFAGSPVSFLANIHCAAATENFYVLENHSVDIDWWDNLISGITAPLIQDGYARVPETPGLGFTDVQEAALQDCIDTARRGGYFEASTDWDDERSHDRLWS